MKTVATSSPSSEFSEKLIQKDNPLSISVVIIAESVEGTICSTLDSLRKQSRKPDEIIVVLPFVDDNALELPKKYPEVRVVITRNSKATRGSSRATGTQHATGDIITLIDADCVAHSEWLEALESLYLKREDILVQGGPVVRVRDLGQVAQNEISIDQTKDSHFKHVNFLPTANLSFRREVTNIVGNFDKRLHEGEDLDFCARLLKHRINIILNPEAIVYHLDRPSISLIKRSISYGKSRAMVFLMHGHYLFSAALVAIVHILLIFASIYALIIHRYDIFLAALGLSLTHQFYNFQRGSKTRRKVLAIKTFAIRVISSYALYASFIIHFLYYLLMRTKEAIK